MQLKAYIQRDRGNASALAKELGLSLARLSQMASGYRPVPHALCPRIESFTKGAVRRWDLRTDWAEVWPELIGTKGSPKVSKRKRTADAVAA